MVRAVSPQETERFELESVDGGYVVLRKLTYGEELKVRGMSMRMHMAQQELSDRRKEARKKGREVDTADIEMTIDIDAVTAYQFSKCVVDHNLEDESGRKLDLRNRNDFARLDIPIGEEIERLIANLNPPPEREEEGEKMKLSEVTKDSPLDGDFSAP